MCKWFKRLHEKMFGERDQKELAELDLNISPTDIPGITLINGIYTRVVPVKALSYGERPIVPDME